MIFYKIILGLCLVASLLVSPTKAIAEPVKIEEMDAQQLVSYFSVQYGTDKDIALAVMRCESGGKNSAVGDNGLSKGIYQFQEETFTRMSKLKGDELDYTSKLDQIKLAVWALGKPNLAREWTAYRAIKNNGKYSFYSKQLKKHFTVYCSLY